MRRFLFSQGLPAAFALTALFSGATLLSLFLLKDDLGAGDLQAGVFFLPLWAAIFFSALLRIPDGS
ncbi:MAG: hypothetical protein KatS3mg057_0632 [Herpetosiphonaceae bacterium]|nr:MAG: hypothetical protein KatS3mg057_0632 [Herpetosiphonaceae bacterium]